MPRPTTHTQIEQEKLLLEQGHTYVHVAQMLGVGRDGVRYRNRHLYHINIYEAFANRIRREGFPVKLNVSDAFGYWFAGLVDGEGSLIVYRSPRNSYDFGLQIALRVDDKPVLQRVQDNIGGHLWDLPKKNQCAWVGSGIAYPVEVLVPLFDRYQLWSKKGAEYELIRPLMLERYLRTLGGNARWFGDDSEFHHQFLEARRIITDLRKGVS